MTVQNTQGERMSEEELLAASIAEQVKATQEKQGITPDALQTTLSTDENGRRFNPAVPSGINAKEAANADQGVVLQGLNKLQRAMTAQPSYRWQQLVLRREAKLRRDVEVAQQLMVAQLYDDADARPALWLRTYIGQCDVTLRMLEKSRADAQAALHHVEEELKPLQSQINAVLRQGNGNGLFNRMADVLLSATGLVNRGVDLIALSLAAERLLNEREAQAFNLDVLAAGIRVVQDARAFALAEREKVSQLAYVLREARGQIAQAHSLAVQQLAPHPYADVDLTSTAYKQHLAAGVQAPAIDQDLTRLMRLQPDQIAREARSKAQANAALRVMSASLIDAMERESESLQSKAEGEALRGEDLVTEAMAAMYQRLDRRVVTLERKVTPRDTRFIGVADETNAGFRFDGANMVGTGRRDQLQMLRIQTGIELSDLAAYNAVAGLLDEASKRRNFHVLDSLANDDRAPRAFALGLACGFITLQAGAFIARAAGASKSLGSVIQDALDAFAQQHELVSAMEEQINALPLSTLVQRLETWLQHTSEDNSDLRVEFAGYCRDKLAWVRDQTRFLGKDALEGAATDKMPSDDGNEPAQPVMEPVSPNGRA